MAFSLYDDLPQHNQNHTAHDHSASIQQQRFRYLVVLDFEATCEQNKQIYPQDLEIIEWPAVIVDTSTNQIILDKTFHFYIKPKHHPKLTPFCQKLTGITQELIDTEGAKNTIESVLAKWNKWCFHNDLLPASANLPRACIVTCGDWDLKTMWRYQSNLISKKKKRRNYNKNYHKYHYNQNTHSAQNTNAHAEEESEYDAALFHSWINVKHIFKRNVYNFHWSKHEGMGMMAMLRHLNIKHEGRHHSGIDDVKNICKIVVSLLQRGAVFDYTMEATLNEYSGGRLAIYVNGVQVQEIRAYHKATGMPMAATGAPGVGYLVLDNLPIATSVIFEIDAIGEGSLYYALIVCTPPTGGPTVSPTTGMPTPESTIFEPI